MQNFNERINVNERNTSVLNLGEIMDAYMTSGRRKRKRPP